MSDIAPIADLVWKMKYRFSPVGGDPVDNIADADIEDSWGRVARALAAREAEPARWEASFREALEDFRFLPAGRVLAGAGTGRAVTLFNCFVMGRIDDDLGSIFTHLRESALTMQQGGGIGIDVSTLRPKGMPVRGVGADASGPISFMDVWDAMCRTIMSAGARRGAMMATLRCDHPDIEDFIDAKRQPGRLRNFNLSVLVTNALMAAVEADQPWPLRFGGEVIRTISARGLWERVMRATHECAEPGVIFIDRVNQLNNLAYCEDISATNPCVTADTWVHAADGPRRVSDLVGRSFTALVDGRSFPSGAEGFFATGRKPVFKIQTLEGVTLRATADHPLLRVTPPTRWRRDTEWTTLGALKPGDLLALHDHGDAEWPGAGTENEGYLFGLLIGDGTLKANDAVVSAWPGVRVAEATGGTAEVERPGVQGVMAAALAAARALRHRADFTGWVAVAGRGEYRLTLRALKRRADDFGLIPGVKAITPAIEASSSAFHRGFLRGFFDADGSVQGTQTKGVSVRLAQSDVERLRAVQRMLARLGIIARIYADRRPAGERLLPDGNGGRKLYPCAADHELVIANANIVRFAARVGFADTDKQARLERALTGCRRALNRERFWVEVAAITADGEEEVYDVQIPGANAFDANGLVAHNCGEQPLPPYGACLLGSINLARLVLDPFEEGARLDTERLGALTRVAVRMLDNAIDVSGFPLPQQRQEALAKRRMGLGVTGLADALILCRTRYGGEEAVRLTESWLSILRNEAYRASAALAAEKGAFPRFEREPYLAAPMVQGLDPDVRALIAAHGARNALLTSIAPTGTISLFAGNVSSGIEPVFSFIAERALRLPDGAIHKEVVEDYAYRLFRARFGPDEPPPDWFVDTHALSPRDHLVMQAAAQRHIDSSISKTINCPRDLPFEDFEHVYREAFALGCKGCTTYRPNLVTGAVLTQAGAAGGLTQPGAAGGPTQAGAAGGLGDAASPPHHPLRPLDRPETLPGETYKVRWPDSDHAMYITLNDVLIEGRRRPFEVFINSKNMEHYAWTVALTRMISAVFRRGGDIGFVVDELKAIFDPRGGHWMNGRYVPSILAAIGDVIDRHLRAIHFNEGGEAAAGASPMAKPGVSEPTTPPSATPPGNDVRARQCPHCGRPTLIRLEGCWSCSEPDCGYSNCPP